jgi:dolichol kinase
LVLAIADPMASLIGLNIPSTKIKVWGGTKTVLGTLTFFLVACGIGILMMQGAPLGIWAPLIAAVVLAFLEFALSYGLDNIAIMVGGVLLYTVFL